jgi:hypothetical protein
LYLLDAGEDPGLAILVTVGADAKVHLVGSLRRRRG